MASSSRNRLASRSGERMTSPSAARPTDDLRIANLGAIGGCSCGVWPFGFCTTGRLRERVDVLAVEELSVDRVGFFGRRQAQHDRQRLPTTPEYFQCLSAASLGTQACHLPPIESLGQRV